MAGILNKLCGWLAAVVTVAGLWSCSEEDDAPWHPEPDRHARQTVMMFMPYSPDLARAFEANLVTMERNMQEHQGLGGNRLVLWQATSSSRGQLVELVYDEGRCYRDTLKLYDNFEPNTAESLGTVFLDMKRLAAPEGGQYALIIGSHGMGWVRKDSWFRKAPTRYFGGRYTSTLLDIDELADALQRAGIHLNFLLFDDCYMAGVEVAYELRRQTDFLVGSTCEVLAAGMPYGDALDDLLAVSPRWQTVVDDFLRYYSSAAIPCGTLSVIDCREMDAMAALMKDINTHTTFDESLRSSLQVFDGFTQPVFYDFGEYVRLLRPDDTLYAAFEQQLQRLVPYHVHTREYYVESTNKRYPLRAFSGISISDPSEQPKVVGDLSQSSWWKATH